MKLGLKLVDDNFAMKVLVLTENYPTKNGLNNGIFVHRQVKALIELGVECYVLLLYNWYPGFGLHILHSYWRKGYQEHKKHFFEYEGVSVVSVPVFIRMPSRFFKDSYPERAARALCKIIHRRKELQHADWLYCHFLTSCGYIGSLAKNKLKIKLAAIARGDDVHDWPERFPILRIRLKEVFRSADILFSNSVVLGNDVQKWMDSDNIRPVFTIYNGVNLDTFMPASNIVEKDSVKSGFGLDLDSRYFLCIASPVVSKGWKELFLAIKELSTLMFGWKLVAVANRRDFADALSLSDMIRELEIEDVVCFIGELSPNEIANIYKACDVFILPSYNEGLANVILEAMASSLPCITTDVGGHREVIDDKVNGILIEPRSVDSIVQAMKFFINDYVSIADMGKRAYQRMEQFGNYRQNAEILRQKLCNS